MQSQLQYTHAKRLVLVNSLRAPFCGLSGLQDPVSQSCQRVDMEVAVLIAQKDAVVVRSLIQRILVTLAVDNINC